MAQAGAGPDRPDDRILVRGAKQLVTLQGPSRMRRGKELQEIGLLRDASILIEGGIIQEVGSARRLENLKQVAGAKFVDARGMVVIPGFVDATLDLLPVDKPSGNEHGFPRTEPEPEPEPDTAPYTFSAMNSAARRLEQALSRLTETGTLFAQFRLRFPEQAVLQSRILRNLLQLDVPRYSFRAVLQLAGLASEDDPAPLAQSLPRAARGFWKQLEPSLAIAISCRVLREVPLLERRQRMSRLLAGSPLLVTRPTAIPPSELLDIGLASGAAIWGRLPTAAVTRQAFARFGLPWIVTGNSYLFDGQRELPTVEMAIRDGMALAIASGFDINIPGSASLPDLLAVFRQAGGIFLEELLHLSISNTAHALGVGHRLGSIEAGKEANLVLFDCDDYREIGVHLGLPRPAAILRRGALIERRAALYAHA